MRCGEGRGCYLDLLSETSPWVKLVDDSEIAASVIGADAGWWGDFVDPDGNEYHVEVKR